MNTTREHATTGVDHDTSAVHAPMAPITSPERSEWLDALRGFALLGILIYNIETFSGFVFRKAMPATHLFGSAFDGALDAIAHVLIQGKFYSLFSFLFGLGIALQLQRAHARGVPERRFLMRRMAALLAIGLVHALLIWMGDILTVYAVFGMALLLFRTKSTRALLGWAIFFLASPVLIYLIFMAAGMGNPMTAMSSGPPEQTPLGRAIHAFSVGTYADIVHVNLTFYPLGWGRRAIQLSLPRIFGMFLLGAWAARIGLPLARDALRPMLRRWLWIGLMLGLPLNIAYTALGGNDAVFPARASGLLSVTLASTGVPLLCLAYVAMFALGWNRSAPNASFVVAGRTALSQYIGQSVVCVLLFYGIGAGLFGTLGYGPQIVIALAVYLLLVAIARLCLSRFAQGPMEAVWRRLSYGRA